MSGSGTGGRPARGCRRLRAALCLAVLAALPVPWWTHAGEPYTARTHAFEAVATGSGPVKLLWDGEIVSESVEPATLCAVLEVKDAGGRVLAELRPKSQMRGGSR